MLALASVGVASWYIYKVTKNCNQRKIHNYSNKELQAEEDSQHDRQSYHSTSTRTTKTEAPGTPEILHLDNEKMILEKSQKCEITLSTK